MSYSGWSNYETWCVALWLDNEPGSYGEINELAEQADNASDLAKQIESYVDDMNPLTDQASMFSDMLSAALHEVDWLEIAEAHKPDDGWPDDREEEEEDEEIEDDDETDPLYDPFFVRQSAGALASARMLFLFRKDLDYWPEPTDPNIYGPGTADHEGEQ